MRIVSFYYITEKMVLVSSVRGTLKAVFPHFVWILIFRGSPNILRMVTRIQMQLRKVFIPRRVFKLMLWARRLICYLNNHRFDWLKVLFGQHQFETLFSLSIAVTWRTGSSGAKRLKNQSLVHIAFWNAKTVTSLLNSQEAKKSMLETGGMIKDGSK